MTNRVLIRHEFIMTADAIPVPVVQKKRKYKLDKKIRICNHCGFAYSGRTTKGECRACGNYRNRTGKARPKQFFRKLIICKNPNCNRQLANDKFSKRHYCNPCFIWRYRKHYERPEEFCKRYKK